MVIRQSNENNLPGSQLRGSQFSWCANGLLEKYWALPGVLLLHWLLFWAREISLCVNALMAEEYASGKKYCAWIWSGKGKTSTIVSWISFMAFVTYMYRLPGHIYYFTICSYNLYLTETVISYMMCVPLVYILLFWYFHMLFIEFLFILIDMLYTSYFKPKVTHVVFKGIHLLGPRPNSSGRCPQH